MQVTSFGSATRLSRDSTPTARTVGLVTNGCGVPESLREGGKGGGEREGEVESEGEREC